MRPVPCFNAYIDEGGDEGFKDLLLPARGSSECLILAGVLVPEEDDLTLSHAVDDLRALLNKPPPKPLHFRDLKHPGKRAAMTKLAGYPFVFSVVALWKPQITSPTLRKTPYLYNYGCRFLVERLSWYAAFRGRQLNLFFSNRASTSYTDLRNYMAWIQNDPACRIERNCILQFQPVNVTVKLVQIADFYASSAAAALEPNIYGLGEESYLMEVRHQLYRGDRGGSIFGTGFKIFPDAGRDFARYPWLRQL
jgi:hypothetical protein